MHVCRVTELEIHVRAAVGNSGDYSGELNVTAEETRCLKFVNNFSL